MENNKKSINLIVVFVVVLLISGIVYLYIKNKHLNQLDVKNPTTQETLLSATSQHSTTTQIKNGLSNVGQDDFNNLKDELIKTKFELAVLKLWQVRQVFRNPQNKNKFYYVTNFSDGSNIWVYDLNKDKTYQQNSTFNISEGNTLLLSQKLVQYQEFRGIGIIDNKFIFTETSSDNSPGPCFSKWFYRNLEYIDIEVLKPIRKSFTLPEDLKTKEEQKSVNCQKAL